MIKIQDHSVVCILLYKPTICARLYYQNQ